jgi:hypothetical protein
VKKQPAPPIVSAPVTRRRVPALLIVLALAFGLCAGPLAAWGVFVYFARVRHTPGLPSIWPWKWTKPPWRWHLPD